MSRLLQTRVVALLAQWDLLAAAFARADPQAASRVTGWTVADLEQHLSQTTSSLADAVNAIAATGPGHTGAPVGLVRWAELLPGRAEVIDAEVRAGGAPPLAEAITRAQSALAQADPAMVVAQRRGAHTLADAVLFHLVEAVVHGLDLPEPVPPEPRAAKLVVQALVGLLAQRAPGRTVEVRVPPYTAVQCIQGPRHTRGTPPNTVETDPITFLLLATGRLSWADASPRVRISGQRAALVADLLPLLR